MTGFFFYFPAIPPATKFHAENVTSHLGNVALPSGLVRGDVRPAFFGVDIVGFLTTLIVNTGVDGTAHLLEFRRVRREGHDGLGFQTLSLLQKRPTHYHPSGGRERNTAVTVPHPHPPVRRVRLPGARARTTFAVRRAFMPCSSSIVSRHFRDIALIRRYDGEKNNKRIRRNVRQPNILDNIG